MTPREALTQAVNRAIAGGAPVVTEQPSPELIAERLALPVTPEILLSTGRIIAHKRLPSGAQEATPTTGPDHMTDAEWEEYCVLLRKLRSPT